MSAPTSEFTQFCTDEVAALRHAQPVTASAVVALLRVFDPAEAESQADAVYSAHAVGPDLLDLLVPAGWHLEWSAGACWLAVHDESGSRLGYFEGLVYAEPETFTSAA